MCNRYMDTWSELFVLIVGVIYLTRLSKINIQYKIPTWQVDTCVRNSEQQYLFFYIFNKM